MKSNTTTLRAAAYESLVARLMDRYIVLFPADAWIDPETALDRIIREVAELRERLEYLA